VSQLLWPESPRQLLVVDSRRFRRQLRQRLLAAATLHVRTGRVGVIVAGVARKVERHEAAVTVFPSAGSTENMAAFPTAAGLIVKM